MNSHRVIVAVSLTMLLSAGTNQCANDTLVPGSERVASEAAEPAAVESALDNGGNLHPEWLGCLDVAADLAPERTATEWCELNGYTRYGGYNP